MTQVTLGLSRPGLSLNQAFLPTESHYFNHPEFRIREDLVAHRVIKHVTCTVVWVLICFCSLAFAVPSRRCCGLRCTWWWRCGAWTFPSRNEQIFTKGSSHTGRSLPPSCILLQYDVEYNSARWSVHWFSESQQKRVNPCCEHFLFLCVSLLSPWTSPKEYHLHLATTWSGRARCLPLTRFHYLLAVSSADVPTSLIWERGVIPHLPIGLLWHTGCWPVTPEWQILGKGWSTSCLLGRGWGKIWWVDQEG